MEQLARLGSTFGHSHCPVIVVVWELVNVGILWKRNDMWDGVCPLMGQVTSIIINYLSQVQRVDSIKLLPQESESHIGSWLVLQLLHAILMIKKIKRGRRAFCCIEKQAALQNVAHILYSFRAVVSSLSPVNCEVFIMITIYYHCANILI